MRVSHYKRMQSSIPGELVLEAKAVVAKERSYTLSASVGGIETIVTGVSHQQAEKFCKELAEQLGAKLVYPESQEDVLYHMDYK